MKPKEKEFCRLMAVYGDVMRAAREAGYRRPERSAMRLLCRADISEEIGRNAESLKKVYENTALCGLYRMAFSAPGDALRLLYRENLTDEELELLDLSSVAEIKRTKDKSMEIKFFDRIKAFERLNAEFNSTKEINPAGGLIEAMRLSAQALSSTAASEGDPLDI